MRRNLLYSLLDAFVSGALPLMAGVDLPIALLVIVHRSIYPGARSKEMNWELEIV